MSIQWYPGHMHKAGKEMDAALPGVDVVVEVLDARLPYSSANPMLETRLGEKPRLRVMTRADLADPARTTLWLDALRTPAQGAEDDTVHGDGDTRIEAALAIDVENAADVREIPERLRALVAADDAAHARHGFRAAPRTAMIVGIPNCCKSTLINRLAGRSIARSGNEPAVTRRQQSVALGDGWRLRDTPGVLWPNVENPASGYRLAASGAVRDTAMDSGEVAAWLLERLAAMYPDCLERRYGATLRPEHGTSDGVVLLEHIGRVRGCIGGGRLVDFDRAGRLVLQEFRNGTLGRITLETPAMRATELVETAARRAALEAKREARREARRKRRRKRA